MQRFLQRMGKCEILSLNEYQQFLNQGIENIPEKYLVPKEVIENAHRSDPEIDVDLSVIGDRLLSALYPFQKSGIISIVKRNGRALLADDMGLGKTLQALCFARYYQQEWPLLIIAPPGLVSTWKGEIKKWYTDITPNVTIIQKRSDKIVGDVVVIGYNAATFLKNEINDAQFGVVILDESHSIKNSDSKRTQEIVPLLIRIPRAILLSGTPELAKPIELYTQILAIDPKLFPSRDAFAERYCARWLSPLGFYIENGEAFQNELRFVLNNRILIRRTKDDLTEKLPPKERKLVQLDIEILPDEVFRPTAPVSEKEMDLAEITEMRANTGKRKIKYSVRYIRDTIEEDESFVIFCHYKDVMSLFEQEFTECGIEYLKIDGSTAPSKRETICKEFQETKSIRVCILSIMAASTGLTLTKANRMFFCELDWTPGILRQCEDRIHRIGQKRKVEIVYFIAKDTVDEIIWNLLKSKFLKIKKVGLEAKNWDDEMVKITTSPN
eukprot:GHVP01061819.1.p1 GENE.GHVP01061819.1~~GHVP01061819.1.p1  ORF type:complete len:526 (-),score=94.91 GHVP01061819.1:126-1616(-)